MSYPARGAVYRRATPSPAVVVVVSRNGRNRTFGSVIVAELQAGRSVGGFATAIQLGDGDPLDGVVLADYLWTVSESHLENFEHLGDLTPATLRNVDAALSVALELS